MPRLGEWSTPSSPEGARCQSLRAATVLSPLPRERRILATSPEEGEGSSGRPPQGFAKVSNNAWLESVPADAFSLQAAATPAIRQSLPQVRQPRPIAASHFSAPLDRPSVQPAPSPSAAPHHPCIPSPPSPPALPAMPATPAMPALIALLAVPSVRAPASPGPGSSPSSQTAATPAANPRYLFSNFSPVSPCMFHEPWISQGDSARAGTDRSPLGSKRP